MIGDRLAEIKHRRKSGIPLWPHETEWMIEEVERLRRQWQRVRQFLLTEGVPPDNERCYECGHSVALGSGRFVNRVPAEMPDGQEEWSKDPTGQWLCAECLGDDEEETD